MRNICIPLISLFLILGCGKDFLDIKRDSNQVVPTSVKDYLSIVSKSSMLESSILLSFLGADEYYYNSQAEIVAMSRFSPFHQFAYTWEQNIFSQDEPVRDWFRAYENIMYANLALDIEKISPLPSENEDWLKVRVAARFYRAWNYYQLAQQFCENYEKERASSQLGLPLRTDYDVSIKFGRSNLQEVYDLILKDLEEADAIDLSPALNIYLPGRDAVEALLARVHLQMGNYALAEQYASEMLNRKYTLIDFNKLDKPINGIYESKFDPDGKNNPTIIFYSFQTNEGLMYMTKMDTAFVESFETGDLRKTVYFYKNPDRSSFYNGSYCGYGVGYMFTGLSVEEMLLVRAECLARRGEKKRAIDDINNLRKHRFTAEYYKNIDPEKIADVLLLVLNERQKELYMRGMRWQDARRINKENKYPVEFKRILKDEDKEYKLPVGSSRWVWPIPPQEITNNNLEQNKRT